MQASRSESEESNDFPTPSSCPTAIGHENPNTPSSSCIAISPPGGAFLQEADVPVVPHTVHKRRMSCMLTCLYFCYLNYLAFIMHIYT
jgi:hypothetical protein